MNPSLLPMPDPRFRRRFFFSFVFGVTVLYLIALALPVRAAGGTVIGKITEPNGTTGVCNASVTLRTSNWTYSSYKTTVCDGAFIFTDVPSGNLKLDVWANHASYFNPDVQSVTVTDDQITNLGSVRLLNANVFGKVTKPDGTTGVSNASVTIRTSDWTISKYSTSDSTGAFKQALTTNGTYIVEVYTYDSDFSRPDNVTITYAGSNIYLDGTNGSLVVKMQTPAMKGKVQLPDGSAAQYASVNLLDSNNIAVQWSSTDNSGNFKIDTVATGTYKLKVYPPYSPAGLVGPDPITVSLTKGTTDTTYQTTPIVMSAAKKTISGKITKSDGTAATDANVSAWQYMGGGYASTTTNASGQYTMTVGSGEWFVSVYPTWTNGTAPDWTNTKGPKKVSFTQSNAVSESATVDVVVTKLTATLTVRVLNPNGTVVSSSDYFSASAWSDGGGGNWCQVSNGSCSMKLAPGTFNVSVYGSSIYGTPKISPVTLKENETQELTIQLLEKNATIKGSVRDTKGRSISSQSVNTWQDGGFGWGWANTDSNGNYSIPVTAGKWCVHAYPSWGASAASPSSILSTSTSYVSTEEPKCINVAASSSVEVNFTFEIADATISGVVVDQSGATLQSVWGWVQAQKTGAVSSGTNFYYSGLGGSISGGSFTLRVPAGTWELCASLGYSGDYTTSECVTVTIGSGDTKSDVKLTLVPNNSTVTGYFRNVKGDIITDVYGSVFAQKSFAYRWSAIENGAYTFKVAAGTWKLGCWVDPSTASQYYLEGTCDTEVTVGANETKRHDIVLKEADSTITVKTLKPDGTPLPNALVMVDTSFGNTKTVSYSLYGSWFNRNKYTDQNGQVTLKVPAGTYFVTTSIDPDLGFINPEKEVITASADSPAVVTLKFLKPDATITGSVTVEGSGTAETFVAASTADGGYVETHTATDGSYTLNVTGGETWTIVAADESEATDKGYRQGTSVEVAKDSTATAPTIALGDGKDEDAATLPEAVSATTATNTQFSMSDTSGASITIPANTITTTNTTVSVTSTPTVELPDTATAVPAVTHGYEIEVRQVSGQNAGQEITTFVGDATVSLPYDETKLTEAGLSETGITMQYFDENAGAYRDVKTSTVNTTENKVYGTTNHVTKFILTSAPVEKKTSTPGTTPSTPGTPSGPGGSIETPVVTPDVTELSTKQLVILTNVKGKATAAVFNPDGTLAKSFKPYGSSFGSFKVAAGDVTGDGEEELFFWETTGKNLPVKVMTLKGKIVAKLTPPKNDPITVTVADLNNDGLFEFILTTQRSPQASLYSIAGKKAKLVMKINNAGGSSGGSSVTVGNISGDGTKELIFTTRPGDVSVTAYSVNLVKKTSKKIGSVASKYLAAGGVTTLTTDVQGDSHEELVVVPVNGGGKLVIIDARSKMKVLASATVRNRTTLAFGDANGDGKKDIVAQVNGTTRTVYVLTMSKGSLAVSPSIKPFGKGTGSTGDVVIGDFNADGAAEVIVSQKNGAKLLAYTYQGGKLKLVNTTFIASKNSTIGYRLLASDLNGDGRREIIAIPERGKIVLMKFQQKKLTVLSRITIDKTNKGSHEVVTASVK